MINIIKVHNELTELFLYLWNLLKGENIKYLNKYLANIIRENYKKNIYIKIM